MLLRTRSFPTDLRASGLSESPYSRALTTIGDGDSRRLQQVLADKRSKTLLQESGAELLCVASENGATGCVEVLLRAGCNPNSADPRTTPPLIASAQNGHSETVKWLLNRGADPCLTDDHGNTALHQALRYGRVDCVEVLLDSRARVDTINDDGNSLLHMAVLSNLAETLRSLLAHLRTTTSPQVTTSIINHQNNQGSTALHEAAAEGFKSCLEVLCACPEIDLEIRDNQGLTAAAQTASDNCQLIITSRDLREAIVVVEVEGSSRARWAVGRLELLQHHTWQDLEVLCDDVLIQYSHFLQGRQGVALRHSRTPPVLLSVPPTNGKVSERLLELLQANSHELLKQMDLIVKQRAKSLVSLGLSPSSISMCQIGPHCYTVPSGSSGEDGAGPRTGPYRALLELTENGELPEVIVTLRDLAENSLDRLSFASMIPAPSLHNYISQLQKHKAVMIHGSLENGHTSLARHLASFIEARCENAKVISVHMHADFTRANLLSLLYNSGALLLCPSSSKQRSRRTVVFILENMERLKQSAVLTELLAVMESRDNGGQPLWVDTVAGDGEVEDYEPLLPAGQYYVSQHCYFILTRTAYTSSNKALPKAMTERFSHIWLTESSEPAAGHLLRHLLRDVVHANKGVLPSRMDVHYQAVVWVWQLWLLYNHYIQLLDLHELTVGPRLFLTCPAISGQADSVYDWLCEMWNFHIVPRVRDAIHHGNHPHKKSKNDTSRLLLAFLTQRLMQISSPLSPEDTQMVLQNLEGVVEMGTPQTPQSPAKRKISPASTFSKNSPIVKRMSKLFSDEKSDGGSPKHQTLPSSLIQDDNRRVRPRSSTSIFSKSGMRRRATLKGSKALTCVEEEAERRNRKHSLVDRSPKDMDDLFDMLVRAGSERLEEQRMPMTGISQSSLPPHHVLAAGSPDRGEGGSGDSEVPGRRQSQHSNSPAGTPTRLPVRHGRKLSAESSSTNSSSPDVVRPHKMQAASPLHIRSNSDEAVYYHSFKRSTDELHQQSSLARTDSSDIDEHLLSNTSLSRSKDTVGDDSLADSSTKDSPRDSGHYDEDEWMRTAPVLPDSQSRNSCALLFTAYSATLGFCLSNSAIRTSSLPMKRNGKAGGTSPGRRTSMAVDALHHWGEGVDL